MRSTNLIYDTIVHEMAILTKKWEVINKLKVKSEKISKLVSGKIKVEEITKILLKNRGIKTKVQEKEFFNPTHPNDLMPGDFGIDPRQLKKVVERIKKAKEAGERVIVWGDYDADGICGSAVLWEALYYNGINALPFIPERRSEGYGLNIARMKQLKEEDPTIGLIITVDNGIVAHTKIDTARDLGMDVIITDHHVPRETKPKAFAVLHTTKICGAAVAWILAREFLTSGLPYGEDHLGIVALAEVADLVPLVCPGRSLVYHGIPVIRNSARIGIKALCEITGTKQEGIGTYEFGFVIAPRLNAMGRLEHALESLRLLCTKSKKKALELAQRLNDTNLSRQQMVAGAVIHAREQVIASDDKGLIFVHHGSYHEGIVGLVASRLVEEFGRPAFVISRGEEFSKGSARSIPGFNIVSLFDSAREYLVEGGGHPMAAGFTVRTEHLELLSQAFKDGASKSLTDEVLVPKLRIDCEIPQSTVTMELALELRKFAPYGMGNPEPVFASRNVSVVDTKLVGADGKHLKLRLKSDDSPIIDAIGFGMGPFYGKLSPGKLVDVAYTIVVDEWNGEKKLQLKLRDIVIQQ